jgi:hypothetical protein
MRRALPGVSASLLLVAIYSTKPPAAVPPDAPVEEFSSGRAMEHVRKIGRELHPMGSPENAEVRRYIVGELDSLGLDPRVQTAAVVDEQYGSPYDAATANNVLARIEGTGAPDGGKGTGERPSDIGERRAGGGRVPSMRPYQS